MAELEAVSIILPSGDRCEGAAEPHQEGRRYRLPLGELVRLGRQPEEVEFAVTEDRRISRFHAVLRWDGRVLSVRERGAYPPKFSHPPRNPIVFSGANVRECLLKSGESFYIGRTRFTLHADGPPAGGEGNHTPPQWEQLRSRTELEGVQVGQPSVVLQALEKLPDVLRHAACEPSLFRQMLKVLLAALPRADAVGLVTADASGTVVSVGQHLARVTAAVTKKLTPDHPVRPDPGSTTLEGAWPLAAEVRPVEFQPSAEVVHRAVQEQKSVLHFWSPEVDDTTLDARHLHATAWAVCGPLLDGSRQVVYATGHHPLPDPTDLGAAARELTGYQKVVGLVVGLMEVTRQTHRLARENCLLRQSLPPRLSRLIDDPDHMKALLDPREADVTVVFGDLRGYTPHVERHDSDLMQAWSRVSATLNDMSRCITLCDGVVIRIQGDAVVGCWGWPDVNGAEAANAARAALQIRAELCGRAGGKTLTCGLGLAHGRAVAGRLGAHDLAEIDLYGPVVNLAARLESLTKVFGVGVIVCCELAARLTAADPTGREWRVRSLGRVRLKGFARRVGVSELLPAHAPEARLSTLSNWHTAVDDFSSGRWDEAYERLDDYFAGDTAAQCLMRVMDVTDRVPPDDWDGTFEPLEFEARECVL